MSALPWRRGARRKDAAAARAAPAAAGSSSSAGAPGADATPYVNDGLTRWHDVRREWTAVPIPDAAKRRSSRLTDQQEDDIYEELLRHDYGPLPKNTTLADVIRILPDVWEKVRP